MEGGEREGPGRGDERLRGKVSGWQERRRRMRGRRQGHERNGEGKGRALTKENGA